MNRKYNVLKIRKGKEIPVMMTNPLYVMKVVLK